MCICGFRFYSGDEILSGTVLYLAPEYSKIVLAKGGKCDKTQWRGYKKISYPKMIFIGR